jgi:hypothetical protein
VRDRTDRLNETDLAGRLSPDEGSAPHDDRGNNPFYKANSPVFLTCPMNLAPGAISKKTRFPNEPMSQSMIGQHAQESTVRLLVFRGKLSASPDVNRPEQPLDIMVQINRHGGHSPERTQTILI